MNEILSTVPGGAGNKYSQLGSSKINGVLASTKKIVQDYSETVYKDFLKSAEVSNQYNGTTTRMFGHADTKKPAEIADLIEALRNATDQAIDNFMKQKTITVINLQNFNGTIVSVLKASALYSYYFGMCWLKKLDERLVNLYGR